MRYAPSHKPTPSPQPCTLFSHSLINTGAFQLPDHMQPNSFRGADGSKPHSRQHTQSGSKQLQPTGPFGAMHTPRVTLTHSKPATSATPILSSLFQHNSLHFLDSLNPFHSHHSLLSTLPPRPLHHVTHSTHTQHTLHPHHPSPPCTQPASHTHIRTLTQTMMQTPRPIDPSTQPHAAHRFQTSFKHSNYTNPRPHTHTNTPRPPSSPAAPHAHTHTHTHTKPPPHHHLHSHLHHHHHHHHHHSPPPPGQRERILCRTTEYDGTWRAHETW
jgi:hypothetical protein